jgi:hypothetical protein
MIREALTVVGRWPFMFGLIARREESRKPHDCK